MVLVGMGERTTPQAVGGLARSLFAAGEATRVIAALMPGDRSFMHLDTVFTFCDRDLVTIYPPVLERLRTFSLRPGEGQSAVDVVEEKKPFTEVVREALGLKALRIVATGGGAYEAEREQWDDGNNVIAVEPGVVIGYDRVYTNTLLRRAGIEVITIEGADAHALGHVLASDVSGKDFAAGSMGPKVTAAIEFAEATGKPAATGRLEDAAQIVKGSRGTRIDARAED